MLRPSRKDSRKNYQNRQNVGFLPVMKVSDAGCHRTEWEETWAGRERWPGPHRQQVADALGSWGIFSLKQLRDFWKWRCVKHKLFCNRCHPPERTIMESKARGRASYLGLHKRRGTRAIHTAGKQETEARCDPEDHSPNPRIPGDVEKDHTFSTVKKYELYVKSWDRVAPTNYKTLGHLSNWYLCFVDREKVWGNTQQTLTVFEW